MSEFTISKSVKDLRIETDYNELMIRVYQEGNFVRRIDCHDMSLAEYDQTIALVIAEMNPKSDLNEN